MDLEVARHVIHVDTIAIYLQKRRKGADLLVGKLGFGWRVFSISSCVLKVLVCRTQLYKLVSFDSLKDCSGVLGSRDGGMTM